MDKWIERINALRRASNVNTDAALAETLGISKATLSTVLSGGRELSAGARFALLDMLCLLRQTERDLMLEVLPDVALQTVKKSMRSNYYRKIIAERGY